MRSAPADVPLQKLQNVSIARMCICLQQAYAAHHHSAGAKRALKCSCIQERLLHWMKLPFSFEPFDGSDGFRCRGADRNLTRAPRRSSNQHGARAALPFSATILGAGQAKFIAQYVQEWRVGRIADGTPLAVDFKFHRLRHVGSPLDKSSYWSMFVATIAGRLGVIHFVAVQAHS